MLIIPPPPFRKSRRLAKRTAAAVVPGLTLLGVHNYDAEPDQFVGDLFFDTTEANPMANCDAADPGKWFVRYEGLRYAGVSIINDVWNVLTITLETVGPEDGPDVIIYTNAPSDIADSQGRKLAAVAGLPIT